MMEEILDKKHPADASFKEIKAIVWDLDNTLWDGILSEGGPVYLKSGIVEIIKELDQRGILHSISSKNNYEDAMAQLREFKIDEYFLYPQISWSSKSSSLQAIQQSLNIGMDTILFIDDQVFEREEVRSVHPAVLTIDAQDYDKLLAHKRLMPRFITEDSVRRRKMYLEEVKRLKVEESYTGPKEAFLASLNMKFIISSAKEEDLKRAEELTLRTNQLNATGITFDYHELHGFMLSDSYKLIICELTDVYGSYGKIGLALVEIKEKTWHLRLLLMSCRVISRSVGTVLINSIMKMAKNQNMRFLADFRKTERNRQMYATYKFSGFKELETNGNDVVFEHDLKNIPSHPSYINVIEQID